MRMVGAWQRMGRNAPGSPTSSETLEYFYAAEFESLQKPQACGTKVEPGRSLWTLGKGASPGKEGGPQLSHQAAGSRKSWPTMTAK